MKRFAPRIVLLAAATAVAACKSAEPPPPPLAHPYKVVLMPVEGAKEALSEKPGESDVPLALTPEALEGEIRSTVEKSHVFSEVVLARPADLATKGDEDEMQAAARFANHEKSDLILRIQVKSARMTDLGPNGSTIWSALTWFMIPAPIWFVADRSYATDIVLWAELFDPADPVKPTARFSPEPEKQDLDLWERGLSPFVLVVPPPFLKGSAKSVSETLTERVMKQLLAKLVEHLRSLEITSRFDEMNVVLEGQSLRISITSRRRLRVIEIDVAGAAVKTWAETGLVEEKDSGPDRFVYRRVVQLAAKPGAEVRVVAEDEAGGREVRTLLAGGSK